MERLGGRFFRKVLRKEIGMKEIMYIIERSYTRYVYMSDIYIRYTKYIEYINIYIYEIYNIHIYLIIAIYIIIYI